MKHHIAIITSSNYVLQGEILEKLFGNVVLLDEPEKMALRDRKIELPVLYEPTFLGDPTDHINYKPYKNKFTKRLK